MEAAADVLQGMAAEKIQALVIHLCTHAHTPSMYPCFLHSENPETHANIHNLSFSVFHKHPPSSPQTHP